MRWSPSALFALLGTIFPTVAFADVHVVDASGNGDFLTIQSAVDEAADGDTLLVRPGTYTGFVIDDKELNLVADANANVQVDGLVEVMNLAPRDPRPVPEGQPDLHPRGRGTGLGLFYPPDPEGLRGGRAPRERIGSCNQARSRRTS